MNFALYFLVFYFSLLLCMRSIAIFLFYIPLILMTLMLTSIKTAVKCALGVIVICFFTPFLSSLVHLALEVPNTKEYLKIIHIEEYMIMFFAGGLSFFILYYYNEFNKIEMKHLLLAEEGSIQEKNNSKKIKVKAPAWKKEEQLYDEKTSSLYFKIISHIETEKLYQNPDLNINMLSKSLNTNSSYVSKALNQRGHKNFMMLVNEYRINQVKEAIKNNAHKKFTMEHIYTQAGFRQQSTFNRIFKRLTGLTPSEYIEKQEKN